MYKRKPSPDGFLEIAVTTHVAKFSLRASRFIVSHQLYTLYFIESYSHTFDLSNKRFNFDIGGITSQNAYLIDRQLQQFIRETEREIDLMYRLLL